jgi:hypothetical protein
MALVHLDARRFELPHQLMIVGRDDDRSSKPVQLDEQTQQPARHLRVDVTGRLVGEQNLRLADDGACDGRALLFPPESTEGLAYIRSPRPTHCNKSVTSSR